MNILVTGATSGIGLAIVKDLVKRGDFVIAVGRSAESCKRAYEKVSNKELKNLIYLPCDLGVQNEIHDVSKKINTILKDKGLDVLINNAGIVSKNRILTEENIELGFAVNHLAPFLLTHLLLPLLKQNQGKVITTGSRSHYKSKIDFDDLMIEKKYFILKAYGRSKLCNALFTYEFNRRYAADNLIAYCLDPGMVKTGIGNKRTNRFIAWAWNTYTSKGQTPEEVSPFYLQLIDNPKHFEEPYYYKYGKFIEPADYAKNKDIAKKLWNISLDMIKIKDFG